MGAFIRNKTVLFFTAVVVTVATVYGAITLAGFDSSSLLMRSFYALRPARLISQEIAITGVDDKSLIELQGSFKDPLADTIIAQAVERLLEHSPRAIFVDLGLFSKGFSPPLHDKVYYFSEQVTPVTSHHPIQHDATPLSLLLYGAKDSIVLLAPRGGPSSLSVFASTLKLDSTESQPAPVDFYFNVYNPSGVLPYTALHEILKTPQSELQADFNNKIVFLGLKSIALRRGQVLGSWQYFVPSLGRYMFPIDIHATALGNLLDRSWIREIPLAGSIFTVLVLAVLATLIATKFALKIAIPALVAQCGVTLFVAYIGFANYFLWSSLLPIMITIPILAILLKIFIQLPVDSKEGDRLQETYALE